MTPTDSQMTPIDSQMTPIDSQMTPDGSKYKCGFCNIILSKNSNLHRHLLICKEKKKIEDKEQLVKYKDMEEENKKLKLQIQNLINTKCKMHYKTLNKINNNLKINGNQINKNNCIEYINNVHNHNTNINIIELGKENLFDVLSEKERLNILKHRYGSIEYLINHVHFNEKYPQFHNIIVTNINNNIAYKYDKKTNQFKAIEKSRLLELLVDSRAIDVETFYELDRDKLLERDKIVLDELLKRMNDNNKQLKSENTKK